MAGKERYPERNAEIRRLRAEGWKLTAIAARYGIHEKSVWQVIHREKVAASSLARHRRLYATDPAYAERCRAHNRAARARKKAEREAAQP